MNGLFIGLTTLDCIHYIADEFGQNVKIAAEETILCTGGPAANAAMTFSLLGGKAHLVSDFGNSELSSVIHNELLHYQISHETPTLDGNCDPIIASVLVHTQTGNRAVAGQKPETSFQTHSFQEPKTEFDVVLSDTYYIPVAHPYLLWANEQGIPTVLDGGSWKNGLEHVLPLIHYAICSEQFFPPGCRNHEETAQFLHQRGVPAVSITRGERPILVYLSDGSFEEIPVKSAGPVIDTLGAGDVFHGAFCYYIAAGYTFMESLRKASAVAAASVCYRGPRAWKEIIA